jgi:hypothetical protein
MARLWMACRAFFGLLFYGRLPQQAVRYLPAPPQDLASAVPISAAQDSRPAESAQTVPAPPAPTPAAADARAPEDAAALRTEGALLLLTLLQREGRLLDFLRESLDGYDDAAIGVAVRDIHRDCRKVLDAHLKVEPVMPGQEDEPVSVPKGFDPAQVRVIGSAQGEPPWKGVLLHHGWRVVDARLPKLAGDVDRHVIAPAEVKLT